MRTVIAYCCGLCISLTGILSAAEPAAAPLTFERDIRPILRAHCFDCHGAVADLKGGLDLRLVRFMQRGGDSGPALVPGKGDESEFLQRIKSGEMPPGDAKLKPEEIAILEQWITAGAPTARPEPETIPPGLGITPEEQSWWAFQPIRRPAIPEYPASERIRTPIDALLRQAMPEGLAFTPDADQRTLLLRVYFDLTGLPPTPAEAARFLNDQRPDAYEHLVDELLNSPAYGERWAQHWLDVAGYSDSDGRTTADTVRTWAYKYRDYVIRSLNSDKPFDRFLHEQLAGDELAGPQQGDLTPEQIELLTATGFLRMAADGTGSGEDTPEGRNQVVTDTIKIVTSSLLGVTVACAQCHDHRYDPIPQTDYYALRAVFEPALDYQAWQGPGQRQVSLYTAANRQQAAEIEAEAQVIAKERNDKQAVYMAEALTKELEKFEEPLRAKLREAYETPGDQRTAEHKELLAKNPSVNLSPGVLYQYNQAAADDLKKYDDRINQVRAKKPVEEFVRVLMERPGHVPETKLFYRGDYRQPTEVVAPGGLSVVNPSAMRTTFPSKAENLPTSGRRLAFAQWLTSRDNPLTARVLVNRFWMHHFGRGFVDTPTDFGKLGTLPTNPALLDWLADEFMTQGWSLKKFHRLILTSTAYRQGTQRDSQRDALDQDNRFVSRKSLWRLEAETLRDRILATTGQLDRTQFGPPGAIQEDETGQVMFGASNLRRSVYVQQRRSQPVAMLQAFDAPVMETNCERRPSSTVATQSLMLMNNEFLLDAGLKLAQRVTQEPMTDIPADLTAAVTAWPTPRAPLWQFGYGSFDEEKQRTGAFTALPHWNGSHWQGGAQLPDASIGWILLTANGGHTGDNPGHAAIRRWTAPAAGRVRFIGQISHSSASGDGVRGRVVASQTGLAGEWIASNGAAETKAEGIVVMAGDTLDFITDCRADTNADSFAWTVEITLERDNQPSLLWKSAEGFHGPQATDKGLQPGQVAQAWQLAYSRLPSPAEMQLAGEFLQRQLETLAAQPRALPNNISPEQQALANLCQALLTSNEFLYVE